MFEHYKTLWYCCNGELVLFLKCAYTSRDYKRRLKFEDDVASIQSEIAKGNVIRISETLVRLVRLNGFKFYYRSIPIGILNALLILLENIVGWIGVGFLLIARILNTTRMWIKRV